MDIVSGVAGGSVITAGAQTVLAIAAGQTDAPSAIIIGAGPSGIAMAHQLKYKLGFEDFTVYEKSDTTGGEWATGSAKQVYERSDTPGGPWATNEDPGCGCGIPTHLWAFSFNLKSDWSGELCERKEVLDYVNKTVDKFDLRSHIHTAVEAVQAQWLEDKNIWSVRLRDLKTDVEYIRYATMLILAVGGFGHPTKVSIAGMNRFEGQLTHTTGWPIANGKSGREDVEGKKVAVIGDTCDTACLVFQLVRSGASVTQYTQFASHWYDWKANYSFSGLQQTLLRYLPLYHHYQRLRLFLAKKHPVQIKMPPANRYEVISEEIEEITETGIVTTKGTSTFDVMVTATHPDFTKYSAQLDVFGTHDGVSLEQYWKESRGSQAYWGSLVAGFPNFGLLGGPNTVAAHTPALLTSEVSVSYISRVWIAPILDGRATRVEVRQAVEDRWAASIQQRLRASNVSTNYLKLRLNEHDRDVASWPGRASEFWLGTWLYGSRGVVYKGGGNGWWINMAVRWIRTLPNRVWMVLFLVGVLMRVKIVKVKVDKQMERYTPYERQVWDAVGKLKEAVGK